MKLKLLLIAALLSATLNVLAQEDSKVKSLEVYGFAMTDMGYNFKQIDPDWFDALRVTKLPTYRNQFAPDGTVFFGIRQSRLGVRGWTQTPLGELKTQFEIDLFGLGTQLGETGMRVRHVYGELGKFLVGQTNTPFMDGDVFPNTLEYWGPTGMVFFRNVQIRYAPLKGEDEVFIALERPGASADGGSFSGRTELDSVRGVNHLPDFSAHYMRTGKWGHVQLAGMLRSLKWQDIHTKGGYDLSGSTVGWGLHLSTVLNFDKDKNNVFRGSIIYGEGVENYMNDAPVDVGIVKTGNTFTPITGKALPVTGIVAYFEHNWSPKLSTAIGYSSTTINNTEFASASAYKFGQYASVNVLCSSVKNFMFGGELQYGERTAFNDFTAHDIKLQFAVKYNFSQIFYTGKN
ncbi:DcaP family trimeric outer membrane transporter [Mucilaginibacter sp. AW1-3]